MKKKLMNPLKMKKTHRQRKKGMKTLSLKKMGRKSQLITKKLKLKNFNGETHFVVFQWMDKFASFVSIW